MQSKDKVDELKSKLGKDFYDNIEDKILGTMSNGGPVERSYKSRVGKIVNKNLDNRKAYNKNKILQAIEDIYRKIEKKFE